MRRPDWKRWIKDQNECRLWLEEYIRKGLLRTSRDESKLHLEKTAHNLRFANWIAEKHKDEIPTLFGEETFYDWATNIYYYAIYHAALALVSREGYKSKNHSATLCFLVYHHYHLHKAIEKEDVELIAGSLDRKDIGAVGFSKEMREKACYDVHEAFERQVSQQIHTQAVQFVNKIKSLLKN